MSAKELIILGTAGNSIDILDTVCDLSEALDSPVYTCIGFLDDNEASWAKHIHGVPVLGPISAAVDYPTAWFVNGIGSVKTFTNKPSIVERTNVEPERFATIIHPTASVSRMASLDHGTVIFQNVTITSGGELGRHVIVLPNSIISHDDRIGDYTCIAGGVAISGAVTIGKSCYLGTHCSIMENLVVGDSCLVGMGSVVRHDVAANSVVAGNPARFLRRIES